MPKDACYKKIKAQYRTFPSARASQALAKCRKSKGQVRKSKKGASLRRWQREKWVDTRTGKPCGAKTNKKQYCRPSRKVSSKTPRTRSELTAKQKRAGERSKAAGQKAAAAPIKRRRKSRYQSRIDGKGKS